MSLVFREAGSATDLVERHSWGCSLNIQDSHSGIRIPNITLGNMDSKSFDFLQFRHSMFLINMSLSVYDGNPSVSPT